MIQLLLTFVTALGVLQADTNPESKGQASNDGSYRNLQILQEVPTDELTYLMKVISLTLGVKCEHCHQMEAWHLDQKPPKAIARKMMHMVSVAGQEYFQGFESASCWTCHRGARTPEIEPNSELMAMVRKMPSTAFSDEDIPAQEVYENLKLLGAIPANGLREVMYTFVASLGVGCTHCHIPGKWSSDAKIQKLMARRMIEIRTGLQDDFFGGREVLSCWTCHRGEPQAQTNLPRELLPSRGDRDRKRE